MLKILGGSGYFCHALRLLFKLVVRFAIQCGRQREFTGRVILLSKRLVNPRQLVVDRTIVIGRHGNLELLFRFPVVAEFGVCGP